MTNYLLFSAELLPHMQPLNRPSKHLFTCLLIYLSTRLSPFLVRNFVSYARLGPSADRRRTVVHRGSDGRTVTPQMSKKTTKNKKSIVLEQNMQNKPNLCPFQAKNSYYEKKQTQSNPIQTQYKAIFTPKTTPKPKTNPIKANTNPILHAIWRFGCSKVVWISLTFHSCKVFKISVIAACQKCFD